MPISEGELALRLLAAAVLGGLVGLERETHGRPAGFRTHILVCVGSSLVMLVSMFGFIGNAAGVGWVGHDPGRLAAQVVSGIGFLGAGTILRDGAFIRGLTTAASLWTVAAIGLAAGSGFYFGAVVATGIVMATLFFLGMVEQRWLRPRQNILRITIADRPGQLGAIAAVLGRYEVDIKSVDMEDHPKAGTVAIEMVVEAPAGLQTTALIEELGRLDGVRRAGLGK